MVTPLLWSAARGVALVAVTCLCAGCGSGSTTKTITTITRTSGLQYARAVNLRADDVPGMTGFAKESTADGAIFGSDIERCGGIEGSSSIFGFDSPRFRVTKAGQQQALKSEAIYSAIYVVGNPTTASRDIAILGNPQFRTCLARYRVGQPKLHREDFKEKLRVSAIPSLVSDVKGFGLRVRGTLAASYAHSKARHPFFEDILAFAVGPAVIVLRAEGTPRPVLSSTEQRLLALLHARATARRD